MSFASYSSSLCISDPLLYDGCVVFQRRRAVMDLGRRILMHAHFTYSFYLQEQAAGNSHVHVRSHTRVGIAVGPVPSRAAGSRSMRILISEAVCCQLFCPCLGSFRFLHRGENTASLHLCQPQCNRQTDRCKCQFSISVISSFFF